MLAIYLILLVDLSLLLISLKLTKRWYAPASLFSGYWLFHSTLGVIFASLYGYTIYIGGFMLITISIIIFVLFSTIPLYLFRFRNVSTQLYLEQGFLKKIEMVIVISSALGFCDIMLLLHYYNYSLLKLLLSKAYITLVGHDISVLRYSNEYLESLWIRLLKPFLYFSPALAGVICAYRKPNHYVIFLGFAPVLLWSIIHTTKAAILFAMLLFISTYLSLNIHSKRKSFNVKNIISVFYFFLVSLLLFLIFVVLYIIRYKGFYLDVILYRMLEGTFAPVFNFSVWFHFYFDSTMYPLTLGCKTFNGPLALLGICDRFPGLGYESIKISSNIYTVFRLLLEDFGIIIFFVILLFSSFTIGMVYNLMIRGVKFCLIFVWFYIVFCFFLFCSFVASIFSYNALIVSLLLLLLVFVSYYVKIKKVG